MCLNITAEMTFSAADSKLYFNDRYHWGVGGWGSVYVDANSP